MPPRCCNVQHDLHDLLFLGAAAFVDTIDKTAAWATAKCGAFAIRCWMKRIVLYANIGLWWLMVFKHCMNFIQVNQTKRYFSPAIDIVWNDIRVKRLHRCGKAMISYTNAGFSTSLCRTLGYCCHALLAISLWSWASSMVKRSSLRFKSLTSRKDVAAKTEAWTNCLKQFGWFSLSMCINYIYGYILDVNRWLSHRILVYWCLLHKPTAPNPWGIAFGWILGSQ